MKITYLRGNDVVKRSRPVLWPERSALTPSFNEVTVCIDARELEENNPALPPEEKILSPELILTDMQNAPLRVYFNAVTECTPYLSLDDLFDIAACSSKIRKMLENKGYDTPRKLKQEGLYDKKTRRPKAGLIFWVNVRSHEVGLILEIGDRQKRFMFLREYCTRASHLKMKNGTIIHYARQSPDEIQAAREAGETDLHVKFMARMETALAEKKAEAVRQEEMILASAAEIIDSLPPPSLLPRLKRKTNYSERPQS